MFYSLATIPNPTDLLATIGQTSSPVFNEFLPWILAGAGILIAPILGAICLAALAWLIEGLKTGSFFKPKARVLSYDPEQTKEVIGEHRRFQKILQGRGIHTGRQDPF